jgi:phosphoribosylformimino-5-aminoimidazole carboxamide ribotide isomerase
MLIIPAIDLKDGKCVRLTEGREDSAKVYDRDPVEVAASYKEAGASLIHIVDLDGAFLGTTSVNQPIIRRIVREVGVQVEVGGGVRSITDIGMLIGDIGAGFVIIGTLAVEQPAVLRDAVAEFGESIVVGIDARGREVATRGWTSSTAIDAFDLARHVVTLGVGRIIYTDITRDGRLEGPNLELTRELACEACVPVTASGGVASLEDIKQLCTLEPYGVASVIVGKALYEGRFTLADAIAAARS